MTVRVGINGLGRIGLCVLRAFFEHIRRDVDIVAVNGGSGTPERHQHLLKYDSVHGPFLGDVKASTDHLSINGKQIRLFSEREPHLIPWKEAGVDVVLECTGKFTSRADAAKHLEGGAKRVIISAPSKDADAMIVMGANEATLKPEHEVISIGSCTTNCLAPIAKILDAELGLESGFMTTIHAYTNDQNILDGSHKDLRRARAAGLSMIPTSTGAASALGQVLPNLKGKLDGTSIRVPTPNVSMVDLTFNSAKETSKEAINALIQGHAQKLRDIISVNHEPLVSVDFNHNPHSAIFDATQTYVVNKRFCRIAAWYDNEWGFSVRMLDVAALVS